MTRQEARAKARSIVSQMTIEEKASQLLYNSPAIERLGINEYNWWNEASHGVARAGTATVFPHAIALAATFSPELVHRVAQAISDEGRAKYNKNIEYGDRDIFKGVTFWAPNINIFRDPRWGRGQETFGEDPFLTASLAVKYIKGLQGDGEFLKAAACAKHFAGHSGPEKLRHGFDAKISQKDLYETYLPAFEHSVRAGVEGVMGAYNRTNGEPCCASKSLMKDILFDRWGFEGYFVSDCWAIADIFKNHKCVDSMAEAAAAALNAGCDLNCGCAYEAIMDAYEQDLVTEEQITDAAVKVYTTRVLLGEFEQDCPYSDIPFSKVDCPEHRALNLESARRGLVLLKNDGMLPVAADSVRSIAVVGPNAMSVTALEGNYNGYASQYITVADGVRRVFPQADVRVAVGSQLCYEQLNDCRGFGSMVSDGVAAASQAEITVLCLGLDRTVEGEELEGDEYTDGGDKRGLFLPQVQQRLAEAVCDNCENVIIVLISGGALDLGEKVLSKARAVVQAFYPGALGGQAVAELIAGVFSPSGRLPVTFHRQVNTLPEFTDYSMIGRTYRYITEKPLYPFGYGLSYTRFDYSDARAESVTPECATLSVAVKNTGEREGLECVQVYSSYTDSRTMTPNYQLCAIGEVYLEPGEEKRLSLDIDRYWLKAVLENGARVDPDGGIELYIGGHQPDERSCELCGSTCLKLTI